MPKPKSPLWGFVSRLEVWEGQSQKTRARCRACGVVFAHGRGGANRAILRAPLCHFNRFCVPQAMVGEKIRTRVGQRLPKNSTVTLLFQYYSFQGGFRVLKGKGAVVWGCVFEA